MGRLHSKFFLRGRCLVGNGWINADGQMTVSQPGCSASRFAWVAFRILGPGLKIVNIGVEIVARCWLFDIVLDGRRLKWLMARFDARTVKSTEFPRIEDSGGG